jgi:hypothetical protein
VFVLPGNKFVHSLCFFLYEVDVVLAHVLAMDVHKDSLGPL